MTKENNGGEFTDYPNEKYRVFFDKFPEINSLDVSNWKPVHLLAYFCKKYQEQYDVKYTFKFNSPAPSKCFEVFQIKRMAMLLSSNPTILKEYIDWVYQTKVVQAKRRLTSISFMTNDAVINEYKINVLLADTKNLNIARSTILPEKYCLPFKNIGISITSYGELAFLSQTEQTSEIKQVFIEIESLGFDKEILGRIV